MQDTMLAWPLYGAGLENLGRDGRPVHWPTPRPAADQILVRPDAVGLCYSDVKIIRQGGSHPRLYGRDLAADPIVQGHEVCMTVMAVGQAWRDRFTPGQRLVLQADIYYRGLNLAYGYMFQGGLAQYGVLGPAILDGDEGCYTIPLPASMGYAEAALTEPWACVEAAYRPRRRVYPKAGGVLWIVGRPGQPDMYHLGELFGAGKPARAVLTDTPEGLIYDLRAAGLPLSAITVRNDVVPAGYAALAEAEAGGGFNDVILLDTDPEQIEAAARVTAVGATVALIGCRSLERPLSVDVGRVHYDYLTFLGAACGDIGSAYGESRNRVELRQGGVAWIIGGGGPMGRMHLQRMLENPAGPHRVVVTESNTDRRGDLARSFMPLATAKGRDLRIFSPRELSPDELKRELAVCHGGQGFDDIVVIVASPEAIEAAMPELARDGMLVVFGGLARGVTAQLDLTSIYLGNAQLTGSAGSTIRDQAAVVDKVAAGSLSTASAVAAIGGMDAAAHGIQGLIDRRFPGKMVIYPQVEAFPLTALPDLKEPAPTVYARLGAGAAWTREAEAEFLRLYAPGVYA